MKEDGNPGELLAAGGDYDPRIRPWYQNAVESGKSTWSDIYVDFKDPRLKVTLVRPIYHSDRSLRGVLGVDFVLSHIRNFLQGLKIGKSGQTFIVERSGLLVAASSPQQPFSIKENKVERIKAVDVERPLIRETAAYLAERFGGFSRIKAAQQLEFKIDGKQQFLQVVPFADGENLDWLIVVVVPEEDFMERIHVNTHTTIALCLVALVVATLIGSLTARWITQPILKLSRASKAIASGDFDRQVQLERGDELGTLARAFNQMSAELRSSHAQLADYSRSLEEKVSERTQELQLEKEKSERLLLNVLPGAIAKRLRRRIAERLKQDQSAIADYFEEATILFADIAFLK